MTNLVAKFHTTNFTVQHHESAPAIEACPPMMQTTCCPIRDFVQYDGSNGDLDWRIDFRYLNLICIIKHFRSRLIKGCSIEWMHLHLFNFNLWFDLIKTLLFKILTYFIKLGEKFYIILRKNTAIFIKQKLCKLVFG